ncbi:MAG: hypothetical protein GYA23_05465 [Methanomicrobiales archaeon]|nr:hypothetical protein [Methanomicrobiales archaeon]
MPEEPVIIDIRAATCTIANRQAFLDELRALAAAHAMHIICFNADMIAGKAHAEMAVRLACRAFDESTAISNTLEMEALLYAAGSRQCTIASPFGIHEGENRLFVCCVPARPDCQVPLSRMFQDSCEDWDCIDPEKAGRLKALFALTADEVSAAGGDSRLADLVLERIALLQVLR